MPTALRLSCVLVVVSLIAVGKHLGDQRVFFRRAGTRVTPCNRVPLFINAGAMLRELRSIGFEFLLVADTPAASNEHRIVNFRSSAHRLVTMLTPPQISAPNGLLVTHGWPCWNAYSPARTAQASRAIGLIS